MRSQCVLLVVLAATALCGACRCWRPPARLTSPSSPSHAFRASPATVTLAAISFGQQLFEHPDHEHFFVQVVVTNRSSLTIGVDLGDYFAGPRPNQWGGQESPSRGAIDESRIVVPRFDEARQTRLRADFAEDRLDTIPAGTSLTYYVEFNASGRADVDAVGAAYVFVSMDGALPITDGARCEQLSLSWDDGEGDSRLERGVLALRTPVRWGVIPEGARVVLSP